MTDYVTSTYEDGVLTVAVVPADDCREVVVTLDRVPVLEASRA